MTIEEKSRSIKNYCKSVPICGDDCPVWNLHHGSKTCFSTEDDQDQKQVEENYDLLVSKGIFPPETNEPVPEDKEPVPEETFFFLEDLDDRYSIHRDLCLGLNDLYIRKNHDYGNSFGEGFDDYGMVMPIIRLEDKLRRLKQLVQSGQQMVKGESVIDTLRDLANYSLMTIVEIKMKEEQNNDRK